MAELPSREAKWNLLCATGGVPHKEMSAFTGVSMPKGHKKWRARIQKDGKKTYLGSYDDEEEAARKYDEAAAILGRPLNFPKERRRGESCEGAGSDEDSCQRAVNQFARSGPFL